MTNAPLSLLFRIRRRAVANTLLGVGEHSKLKLVFVSSFALCVLAGLFLMFFEMFRFMARFPEVQAILTSYLFALFFLSLTVMLTFSTCIIAFTSLFHSREAIFLQPRPFRMEDIFLYKLTESMTFSSWAFLLLGVPLITAYGVTNDVPWYFYPMTLLFFAAFIGIPAGLGGLITLLIATYFPRRRKQVVALVLLGMAVVAGLWACGQIQESKRHYSSIESWVSSILGRISFCQNPLLPSHWMSEGILASARGYVGKSAFFLMVTLSNALFFLLLAYVAAALRYRDGWSICQAAAEKKNYKKEWLLYRALRRLLFFQPPQLRLLIMKDVKTFFRDPGQWSQVLLFVGLLFLYVLNLRNLGYHLAGDLWKSIISFLNLSATALVLSTFTGRFVFPMLSLEGKTFWVLGLMPVSRRAILMGKFFFALGGALLVSETLIILSDWMLEIGPTILTLHIITIAILCVGLSAIAVGLGATFPNLREENPSKIIAGFGGTLNLLISLAFIAAIIALMAAPSHLYVAHKLIPIETLRPWVARAIAIASVIALLACVIPLAVGLRSLAKLEF
ncbi:MAG: hypothetical protein GXP25_23440 [Planctomycetes bacterium]|nr:hypothetical protein [Planctomycetota bacterium]